jgi:hypothetical protein
MSSPSLELSSSSPTASTTLRISEERLREFEEVCWAELAARDVWRLRRTRARLDIWPVSRREYRTSAAADWIRMLNCVRSFRGENDGVPDGSSASYHSPWRSGLETALISWKTFLPAQRDEREDATVFPL